MKIIAIIIGKIIILMGRLLHRGSSLPGKVALKLKSNLLSKLKYPDIRIAVTGSSGKGSTSKLIASVLRDTTSSVCFNDAGSNLAWGITTSLLKYSNIFGKIKAKYLVIEVDERYAKEIFKYLKPTHLVITNLTKDQPPRQYDVDTVYLDVLASIEKDTKIITNMDDPYLRNFSLDLNNSFLYYSIAQNKYSYKHQIFENLNIYYCPKCGAYLDYEYYNFETLGKYQCPKCDFGYIKPSIVGENLDLTNQTLTINKKELNIGGNMLYHAYNTLAAYTVLNDLDLKLDIIKSINNHQLTTTTMNKFYTISCKAENATTYNQAIFKVLHDKRPKDIVLGHKEISRRYNHFDISWLYDIEFELLNNDTVNKIYACGIDAKNFQKRLILAGIPKEKIVTSPNLENIKDDVLNDEVEIVYGILNFDYVEPFNNLFEKECSKCK